MSPDTLAKIGDYELKEKLGQGGYGAVYRARDPIGRDVAIKVLTSFGDDNNTIEGFKKEATTLARLSHRNIVTVYQFGVDNGRPYLAMEYLQGQPLSAIIKAHREMHLVEKLDIIIQASEGLRHAHENKVIHRDIKPHNLMVVENSVVKLIDFGIAQGDNSKSQSRQEIAGSLPYMSPEHFVQKRTPWCDIFSMGVVLYELLSGGQVPYASDRDDLPVAYHKLMSNDPAPPLSQYVQNLPPGLEEVVSRAISKNKLNGFETAEEFVFELSRVQDVVKSDFVGGLLAQVDAAVKDRDFSLANDLLTRILRVDPNNAVAKRREFEFRKQLKEAQRNQQVRQICVRVEEAIQSKKFDLAQLGLDEARQLDPGSNTVKMLEVRLRERRQLEAQIEQLIRQAEVLGREANWEQAEKAVEQALAIEGSNTTALRFQEAIRQAVAQERRVSEQARVALEERRFQEAFELIRQAEAIAPRSQRVAALKELAVNLYTENIRRTEVAAALRSAQEAAASHNFAGARAQLDEAVRKYPDERALRELLAQIEQQQEQAELRRFIDEQIAAAESAIERGIAVSAVTILEQTLRHAPDEAQVRQLLETARAKLQAQDAQKRREQYLKSAGESLAQKDASSAVITLEMAQSEFSGDSQIAARLEEARGIAKRQAAERAEIEGAITSARQSAQSGDFAAALKIVEQSATRHGLRPELSAAAGHIQSARVNDATARVLAAIERAQAAAEAQHYEEALSTVESAKAISEFAVKAVVDRLAELDRQVREAAEAARERAARAMEAQSSATRIFQSPTREVSLAGPDVPTTAVPMRSSAAAATAPARAPSVAPAQPIAAATAAKVAQATAPARSAAAWMGIAAVVLVVVLAGVLYFVLSASKVEVTFDVQPARSTVAVDGRQCLAPCSLKLKPGSYAVQVTHDQYSPQQQTIEVGKKPSTVTLALAAAASAVPAVPETGTLSLKMNVDAAEIFIDNQLKETAAGKTATLAVPVGGHEIRVQKQGYTPATQSVQIAKGSESSLQFSLTAGASATVENPYVIVKSIAGAVLSVDSKQQGTVGADGQFSVQVAPGRHSIALAREGYTSSSRTITARLGERPQTLNMMLTALAKAASVVSFAAADSEIQAGKSTVLKWETQNAAQVTIDGLGTFPASGTKQVSPAATTTYTLTAKGPGGNSAPQSFTVKVAAAAAKPVIVSFVLGSDTIQAGEKTKIVWAVQNATSVSIDPGIGEVSGSSGSPEVSPAKTTTYVLTATGPGGSVKSQPQTLTVVAKAAASAQGPSDIDQIKDLLEHRWTSAFESRNANEVKAIWPSIPKDVLESVRKAPRGFSMSLSCTPTVSGDHAHAQCSESATLDGQTSKTAVAFSLVKAGTGWQIQANK